MSSAILKSDYFLTDFELQFRWYAIEAGRGVAAAYLEAVHETLGSLAIHPDLGRLRRFREARLKGIRSFRVRQPFNQHLIFYRHDRQTLYAERLLHGARDLPQRLRDAPGA